MLQSVKLLCINYYIQHGTAASSYAWVTLHSEAFPQPTWKPLYMYVVYSISILYVLLDSLLKSASKRFYLYALEVISSNQLKVHFPCISPWYTKHKMKPYWPQNYRSTLLLSCLYLPHLAAYSWHVQHRRAWSQSTMRWQLPLPAQNRPPASTKTATAEPLKSK